MSKRTTELVKKDNLLSENKDIDVKEDHFKELMSIYEAAMDKMTMYLNEIKRDVKKFYDYDVIDHISSRLKSPESIITKMEKKGYELNYKELIENIHDVAGVRVVCPLKDDIYKMKEIISNIDEIKVIEEVDYVSKPKKSGYRSYHMICSVPVEYKDNLLYVNVEVQIRTMAMDFWATLEHRMKYKSSVGYSEECSKEFIKFAKTITSLDNKIEKLYEKQHGKNNIVVLKR